MSAADFFRRSIESAKHAAALRSDEELQAARLREYWQEVFSELKRVSRADVIHTIIPMLRPTEADLAAAGWSDPHVSFQGVPCVPYVGPSRVMLDATVKACSRYNPCGKHDCKDCYPGQGLPPDQWGRKKKGGAERGYRVVSVDEHIAAPSGARPGETFMTPDAAVARAKRDAKAGCEAFIIFRDGSRWLTVRRDGSTDPAL